jgi:hypothetical protein
MTLQDYVKQEYSPEQQVANRDEEMKKAFLEESGLEGKDVDYLRKQFLSADEALAAKTEQNDEARARKSRKKDWEEYIDFKRRWGRSLHHSEIIARLRTLIPNLCVADGQYVDTLSLYIWDKTAKFDGRDKTGGTVFIGWLHVGENPEYECDIVNDVGVAVKQLRGWRTLLVRFICRRDAKTFMPRSLFTEEQALAAFGPPSNGATASNYRGHMWKFRNTSPERAKMEHQILEAAQRYHFA